MRQIGPDLLSKLNSNEQTAANKSEPKMSVQVSRARTTVMDSTYWTVETIRTKAGLGDISLAARRLKAHGRPDRLYEIHVDGGQVKTTIREYPDLQKDGWQPQFELGPGSAVAIAFDGEWELWRKKWRLKTVEEPWIFWVDAAGVLWAQLWDDVTTKVELASGVTKVKAIRGWKNFSIQANDQGIIAAYIKTDGSVHYRNYCRQADDTTIWEVERALSSFSGTALNLNLFITNDYRMGFVIQNSTNQISWHITQRNWAGMAYGAENIRAAITDITFDVIPINYEEVFADEHITATISDLFFNVAEPIYPAPQSAENEDEYTITLTFNHLVDYDLTTVASAFTIKDSTNTAFSILSTAPGIDNSQIVFTMANFASASGNMLINYDRTIIELDSVNQGSRFAIESFSFEFTPDLAPPEGHAFENITVSILPTFVVSQVYYRNGYASENITASIADVAFVVTKVGSNPL